MEQEPAWKAQMLAEAVAMFETWARSADAATLKKLIVSFNAAAELRSCEILVWSKDGRRYCRLMGEPA